MNILSKLLHKLAVRLEGYSYYTQLSELRSLLGECHETSVFKSQKYVRAPRKSSLMSTLVYTKVLGSSSLLLARRDVLL